ncbi:hypothetical protein AAFF_G00359920 [Aldrovandia affinis]|uniref:Uncharacterized protein n=1 Tax=Aldrovandia affinis TaxID=143900 RepID=A0AAD7WN25_9TELE|nr:hypothetical protein AAFF_G00359920 [Aldrovandia affinis]
MIRQKQKREILTKLGMARPEEPLTPRGKNTMTHLSGQNLRPVSKNGRDSKAPGRHLSPGRSEVTAAQLTAAGAPREGAARGDPPPEPERERENLPPRRPLRLAPLELPKEVKESQRRKIKGIQQEAMAATRKLDALGNGPRPRKARTDARRGPARSPGRSPRRPLREPAEREAPRPMKALLPVAQALANGIPCGDGGGVGREGARGQAALLSKPAVPPSADARAQPARTGEATAGDTGRRRLRLRRAQGLDDEDQNKSSVSTAGRLSSDEGKEGQAGKEKGQRAEKALREASHMLDKASRRNTRPLRHTGSLDLSGKAVGRAPVNDIHDAAF